MMTRKDKQWNFLACLTDAAGWPLGAAMISTSTILPVFLHHLGAGNISIGALPALYNLLVFAPGLIVANYISRLRIASPYLFIVALLERLALVPIAVVTFYWSSLHPEWIIITVFICIGLNAAMMGINQPAYWIVIGKCVLPEWRGRLFGIAGGLAGLFGILGERVLQHLLSGPTGGFPYGFAAAFSTGVVILFISVLPLGFLREPISKPNDDPHGGHYLKDSIDTWRQNAGFRRFLRSQIVGTASSLAAPFFILDAVHRLHAGHALAGFTATLLLTSAFGGLICGYLSDHTGNKVVLQLSTICLAAAPLIALLAPSALAYYLVFGFFGLGTAGIGLAGNNIVMEYAGKHQDIPLYTALYNALTALPRMAAPLAGGLIADHTGYMSIFILSSFLAMLSLGLVGRANEPRAALEQSVAQL